MTQVQARIVTFNIRVGCDAPIAQIASDLCSLNADLTALQELGSHWSMGPKLNQLSYLSVAQNHKATAWLPLLERAWDLDPYQGGPFIFDHLTHLQSLQAQAGHFGIGLSGIGRFENIRFTYLPKVRDEQRGLIQAVWHHPSASARPLTVWCTHLSIEPEDQALQIAHLIELSQSIDGPALLLADLNHEPHSRALQELINAGWNDLHASSMTSRDDHPHDDEVPRSRYTFSVKNPHRCIDYILGRGVCCEQVGVAYQVLSSDHFPIWADISW